MDQSKPHLNHAFNLPTERLHFLDHLRAFMFVLLAFDHCIHAYAYHFGKFHFIKDFNRSLLYDIFYMFDNSVIMPMLFFIFGLFVIPAVQQRGLWSYIKNRLLRLGVPYVIGIPLIVPLLVFPRYHLEIDQNIEYFEFWKSIYFADKLQGGGPFWVLFCLALYSTLWIVLYKAMPKVWLYLAHSVRHALTYPKVFIISFITVSCLILGLSDLKWGAPWWISIDYLASMNSETGMLLHKIVRLFSLQGSRFLIHALYFMLGAMLSVSGLTWRKDFWHGIAYHQKTWLILMLITGTAYISYTLMYINDGAYSPVVYRAWRIVDTWQEIVPIVLEYAPKILIRTSLHGLFVSLQCLWFISFFYNRCQRQTTFWYLLTPCCYGIFLIHEVPVIWLQFWLGDTDLPIFLKIVIDFSIGVTLSWIIIYAFRQIKWLRRIL